MIIGTNAASLSINISWIVVLIIAVPITSAACDNACNANNEYDTGYYEGYENALMDVLTALGVDVDDDDDFREWKNNFI